MKYRPEIDGLRAISVIFVILFHFEVNYFSKGFVGVDLGTPGDRLEIGRAVLRIEGAR